MHDQPLLDAGEIRRPLSEIVKAVERAHWQFPHFQRDFVWKPTKTRGWAQTITSSRRIKLGVIVTYQIRHDDGAPSSVFVADGRQRIEATRRFIQAPTNYVKNITTKQAWQYCDAFAMTVQHNILKSHDEGLWAFKLLNMGTSVVPAEFYKGELTRTLTGEYVWRQTPIVVNKVSHHLVKKDTSRKRDAVLHRDSLALFYQYVSGTDEMAFWNIARGALRPDKDQHVIERIVADFIQYSSQTDLEKSLGAFQRFLEGQTALLSTILRETGHPEGVSMTSTVYRWLMHVAIWRRNTSRPERLHEDFLTEMFRFYRRYPRISSRIEVPHEDGYRPMTLSVQEIRSSLRRLCDVFEVPLYDPPKRKKRASNAPGYDNSHEKPFSTHGEGPVEPEPAPRNRSRGNRDEHGSS